MEDQFPAQIPAQGNSSGFDRMRSMLARAAEMRADEQRQFSDALSDVRTRILSLENFFIENREQIPHISSGLDSLTQRLSELPDRTEVSVLAERLDEMLARMDVQDRAGANMVTMLTQFSERMVGPTEALGARLEGMGGRFEGVSGRLDGLAEQNAQVQRRLDEQNDQFQRRLDEQQRRLDEVAASLERLHAKIDALPQTLDIPAVHRHIDEFSGSIHNRIDNFGAVRESLDDLLGRPAVDPTDQLEHTSALLDALSQRLDGLGERINAVEENVRTSTGTIAGYVEQGADKVNGAVSGLADRDELTSLMWAAQAESEKRMTAQIRSSIDSLVRQMDHALAQLGEMMISGRVDRSLRPGGRMTDKKSLEAGYGDDE